MMVEYANLSLPNLSKKFPFIQFSAVLLVYVLLISESFSDICILSIFVFDIASEY